MSYVVYRSEVRIKRVKGPVRKSVSSGRAGAGHFRRARRRCGALPVPPAVAEPRATTLGYIVAAAAG
jgi:hypothetical protein